LYNNVQSIAALNKENFVCNKQRKLSLEKINKENFVYNKSVVVCIFRQRLHTRKYYSVGFMLPIAAILSTTNK